MFDHERSLVEKYQGRPFVLLGVNEDDDRRTLQKAQAKYNLNWRSWADEDKSIALQWNAEQLPTLFLLDHKGVVRWQEIGVPDPKELDQQIEQLVREAETEGGKLAALSRRQ
jgi:peroxiredoxin